MGTQVRSQPILVTDDAFPYLRIQKGSVPAELERSVWEDRYRRSVMEDFRQMRPYLPRVCNRILDIGGGMGGIDILLSRHWLDRHLRTQPEVTIVDGMGDPPEMKLHRETFSNAAVANGFLAANGVEKPTFMPPSEFNKRSHGTFDLIISLGAWCFHIPPAAYLDDVRRACRPGTVLILDVRKERPAWRGDLNQGFEWAGQILERSKFQRVALHAR